VSRVASVRGVGQGRVGQGRVGQAGIGQELTRHLGGDVREAHALAERERVTEEGKAQRARRLGAELGAAKAERVGVVVDLTGRAEVAARVAVVDEADQARLLVAVHQDVVDDVDRPRELGWRRVRQVETRPAEESQCGFGCDQREDEAQHEREQSTARAASWSPNRSGRDGVERCQHVRKGRGGLRS